MPIGRDERFDGVELAKRRVVCIQLEWRAWEYLDRHPLADLADLIEWLQQAYETNDDMHRCLIDVCEQDAKIAFDRWTRERQHCHEGARN